MYQHFWPPNDIHFGIGISGIIDKVSLTTNDRNYLFVNLNRYSLLRSLSFFSKINYSNKFIIIISSSRLMPLAHFWLAEYDNIIAVFDTSNSVDNIIKEICLRRDGEKITKNKLQCQYRINSKDIVRIKYFLSDTGMEELQDRFMNSLSTMYRWRKDIAVKFGVREPRYLLLP